MTPNFINLMIWYYVSPDDYAIHHRVTPAEKNSFNLAVGNGLLTRDVTPQGAWVHTITDKGRVYVKSLCGVKLPRRVEKFVANYPKLEMMITEDDLDEDDR